MKTSCIKHPCEEHSIVIHEWQVEFCDGDVTAAALLSYFEYWHNLKLEYLSQARQMNAIAKRHGDNVCHQDTTLFQVHTMPELIKGIIHVGNNKAKISKAIKLLVEKSVITIHKNPNPNYKFDQGRYFLFHPEVVNTWLANRQVNQPDDNSQEEVYPPGILDERIHKKIMYRDVLCYDNEEYINYIPDFYPEEPKKN